MTNLKSNPDFPLGWTFISLFQKDAALKFFACSIAIHWLLIFHNLFISSVIYNNYVILEIGTNSAPENERMACQITSLEAYFYLE